MSRVTIRGAAGFIGRRRPSGFSFQNDTTGYTTPTPVAHNFPTTALTSVSQPGSRIYFVDPDLGDDATAGLYFWNGSAIVDSSNSTTGAGGVAYGTDPFNPTGPIKPFKRYYACAPRTNGSDYTGTPTNSITQSNATPFRAGKPDWWLFRRGRTVSLYSDFRGYLDSKGLTTTPTLLSSSVMGTGGSSLSAMCVIGPYGPVSDGRPRLTDALSQFFARNGGTYGYTLYTGIMTDGTTRDRAIRPVDWPIVTSYDQGIYPVNFINLNHNNPEIRFEDCHFHACGGSFSYQWAFTHTIPTNGLRMYRNIISNNWGCSLRWIMSARKTTGDQVIPANTAAVLTWPTVDRDDTTGGTGTGSGAMNGPTGTYTISAANAYTSWGGQRYFNVWGLMDVTAIIPPTGSITVSVLVNGVVKSSYTTPGVDGANLATYQLHTPLETGPCATGNTIQLRITSTGALSSLTVLGTNTARLTVHQIEQANSSGHFMTTNAGTRFDIQENIYITNGFGVDPAAQTSTYPDGTAPRFDWDTRNHNLYFVGDIEDWANCIFKGNVSIVGAAGDNGRCPVVATENFYYQGYVELRPEHNTRVYTSKMSEWTDNVLQRFRSVFGVSNAHPCWGYEAGSGAYAVDIKRNIVSDVAPTADGFGQYAVKITGINSPYFAGAQLVWVNDTSNNTIDGNIFDATGNTQQFSEPIIEANGARFGFSQWQAWITPPLGSTTGNITGTILTCTPSPGYTLDVGVLQPQFQWYRYPFNGTDTSRVAIAGATGNTYTLGAQGVDWTISRGTNYYMVACVISGITYPPGVGMSGNVASNNVFVMPALNSNATTKQPYSYYNMNSSANPAPPPVFPAAAATGTLSMVGNTQYTTRALAQAARGGSDWNASLKTAMIALQIPVTSDDGLPEYRTTILGANPLVTAMMRGKSWDTRFTGRQLGNHVRAGRGMTQVGVAPSNSVYVRAGATGNGSGSDWNNAMTSLPNTLVRGMTYWLADGSMAGRTFNTANSGTTTITLKKATAASHGTNTGWNDAFGDGQFAFTSECQFHTDYWVVDGQVRNSNWRQGAVSQYGIKINTIRLDNASGVGADHLTFKYVDFYGDGRDTGNGDDVVYSLVSNDDVTFQYCALHDSDRTIFITAGGLSNWLVEKCYIARNTSSAAVHSEMHSMWGSTTNYTAKDNQIDDCEGTAIWAGINDGTASGVYIYGNVIQHTAAYNANTGRPPFGTDPGTHSDGISGLIYIANDASNTNFGDHVLFYNNSMYGIRGSRSGIFIEAGTGSNEVRNNLWYNCSVDTLHNIVGGSTFSHNWYYLTSSTGDGSGTKQIGSANPFVNVSTNDFHLTAATNAGFALSSPYNVDPDGVARDGDGTWDRGAFEF